MAGHQVGVVFSANSIRERLKPILDKVPAPAKKELGKLIFEMKDGLRERVVERTVMTDDAQRQVASVRTEMQIRVDSLNKELLQAKAVADQRQAKVKALENKVQEAVSEAKASWDNGIFQGQCVACLRIIRHWDDLGAKKTLVALQMLLEPNFPCFDGYLKGMPDDEIKEELCVALIVLDAELKNWKEVTSTFDDEFTQMLNDVIKPVIDRCVKIARAYFGEFKADAFLNELAELVCERQGIAVRKGGVA